MHSARRFFCWQFAFVSSVCLYVAISNALDALHPHRRAHVLANIVVLAVFGSLAVVFGMTWWSVWREKRAARLLAITSSIVTILLALLPIVLFHRGPFLVLGGVGIAGLIVYWRYEPGVAARAEQTPQIPGDGTGRFITFATELLSIAVGIGILYWWWKWLLVKEIPPARTGIPSIVFAALILLLIIALHEIGHTIVGLTLGMKLRSFQAGPLQWHIRSGRWDFQFKLSEIFPTGGGTGMVPSTAVFSRRSHIWMIAAGPSITLLTGSLALWLAFTKPGDSPLQLHGVVALFGAWSLLIGVINLFPFRTAQNYSDGAAIYQLLSNGPLADYQRTISVIGSTLVTPLRPKDLDIEEIQRAAGLMRQGIQGMALQMFAYMWFLDWGRTGEAKEALKEAESIYVGCASQVPAESHLEFVFANAYLRRDAVAAREWWTRMEAKKPTRFNVDYWKAYSALRWIEGDLKEANEAWEKANAFAQELPNAGAYEFDRHCCTLLRQVIDEAAAKSTSA